jgi:hypothetical protein
MNWQLELPTRQAIPSVPPSRGPFEQILDRCATRFGCSRADITGPSRVARLVRARHCAAWLARRWTPLSTVQIGQRLGGRDHTTVLHAYAVIEAGTDAALTASARRIETALRADGWRIPHGKRSLHGLSERAACDPDLVAAFEDAGR